MTGIHFNIGSAGQIMTGNVAIQGDNIGAQYNYGQDTEAVDLAKEIDELLTSLEPTIPNLSSPTGQETLKAAALQAVEKTPLKTRLLKALRAGAGLFHSKIS